MHPSHSNEGPWIGVNLESPKRNEAFLTSPALTSSLYLRNGIQRTPKDSRDKTRPADC